MVEDTLHRLRRAECELQERLQLAAYAVQRDIKPLSPFLFEREEALKDCLDVLYQAFPELKARRQDGWYYGRQEKENNH